MKPDDQEFRESLRSAGEQVPDEAQVEAARRRLRAAIRAESEPPRTRASRWRLGLAATAGVALTVFAMIVVFPGPRGAGAALAELAQQTRRLTPQELPAGSFVYTRSEGLAIAGGTAGAEPDAPLIVYLLPTVVEAWWSGDTVQREITVGTPIFFDEDQERFYYAAGLDRADGVGETRTETEGDIANQLDPAGWATDPQALRTQIENRLEESPSELPRNVQIFQLSLQLFAPEVQAPPRLRSALLELLNTINPKVGSLADGKLSVSIDYEDPVGDVTETAIFDQAGYLVDHTIVANSLVPDLGAPPGTIIGQELLSPPTIVPNAGTRP